MILTWFYGAVPFRFQIIHTRTHTSDYGLLKDGEMIQWLRVFTALPKDPSLVSITHNR